MTRNLAEIAYGDEPSLLLLAAAGEARDGWARAAGAAGCRLIDAVALDEAGRRLDRQVAADVVVLEASDGEADALEELVGRVENGAGARRFAGIVAAPLALADRVAGRLDSRIAHLIDAGQDARIAAIMAALDRPRLCLEDVNKANGTVRLQQLSEEVGRIASLLAALSEDETAAAAVASLDERDGGADAVEAAQIRAIIRARRMRDHFFRGELFADPAWDMLLDLMAARLERNRVAVSSLCIAAAVPPTTALRWIKTLCDQGVFVRVADPEDGRRVFIELADSAAAGLESYFKAVQRVGPLTI
ncbi:MAG: winged helix DNA-binding protein [Allosphingosinicella sp.]